MGKVSPYYYTDSDEAEATSSSAENVSKKRKISILKCKTGNLKRKKCKHHSRSEPEDVNYLCTSKSSVPVKHKLPGILKICQRNRDTSDDDEDFELLRPLSVKERCLVGRVPRPAGAKPGRGGGVAIVVKKNTTLGVFTTQRTKKKSSIRWLNRKRSY